MVNKEFNVNGFHDSTWILFLYLIKEVITDDLLFYVLSRDFFVLLALDNPIFMSPNVNL